MDYDPDVISYEKLLEVFWDSHSPDAQPWSRQYMSLIFYHSEAQKKSAMASKDLQEDKMRGKIHTEILPFNRFFLAEDYHQKYRLRSEKVLMRDFNTIYPTAVDFLNSTAAARINGYLGGYGTYENLLEELPGFGLSSAARKILMEIVKRRNGKTASKL